jgi:serralysin
MNTLLYKAMFRSRPLLLPILLGVAMGGNAQAESNKQTSGKEMHEEVKGESVRALREQWESKRLGKIKADKDKSDKDGDLKRKNELSQRKAKKIDFPAPPRPSRSSNDARDPASVDWLALLKPLADLLLPAAAEAATYGTVNVNGDITDWAAGDRLTTLANGTEVYGKYVGGATPVYVFALKVTSGTIAPNTTLWLNTDQNAATGNQIWGAYGGAEYEVNVYGGDAWNPAGSLHLYNSNISWLKQLTDYAYNTGKTVLEFAVPAADLGLSTPRAINVLGDINDSAYFPEFYSSGTQYTVATMTAPPPPTRTDLSKRVGIVYSAPTKNNFYQEKAYSQLFMSLQHQAMMAGIRFDLLNEADLTDATKLVNYDALVFPYAANVTGTLSAPIQAALNAASKAGMGIIAADNWLTNNELGAALPGDPYQAMKQLLGVTREGGAGPVALDVVAGDVTHPAMKGYAANEPILASAALNSYKYAYTSYFTAVPGYTATVLANQAIPGVGTKPAVIATTSTASPARNVHFATSGLMADANLVWQALQWVVYGTQTPVALKMGRNNNLFVSRNDMDQSQEYGNTAYDDMGKVDVPLYEDLAPLNDGKDGFLPSWKNAYNFVGSYYINIGNAAPTQQTVWLSNPTTIYDAKPLYTKYEALGNEIGTHSYTHPADTNLLTPTQVEFEFNQSMNQIASNLNPTWQTLAVRGAAVPGAPETVATAHAILPYVDYLSGGGSMIGAGYPSAIGYLTPADTKVYYSPNMSFDFTLIEFGVPEGSPAVAVKKTAAQAEAYWAAEYDRLMKHAAQPIVHWAWHDYGPTSGTTAASGQGYTVSMFQNTIAKAFNTGAEFATGADVAQRINTFRNAKLTVTQAASQYTATVNSANVGKFSIGLNLPAGQKIKNVTNWYAYNDDKVFLPDAGGTFVIQAGTAADAVTHITALPMRAKLNSVTGNGANLTASFDGEGTVTVALSSAPGNFNISSDSGVMTTSGNTASIKFATFGTHTITIALK